MSDFIKRTYWANNGKHEKASKALEALVPVMGAVEQPCSKNRALEKFRKASNCYYDLYNNGLCNLRAMFRQVYGFTSLDYAHGRHNMSYADTMYVKTEAKMDEFIVAAAHEQGLAHLLSEELETA